MAVVSNTLSARLRLADTDNDTVMSVSGVEPAVTANELTDFTLGVTALRNTPIGAMFLTVDSELVEE